MKAYQIKMDKKETARMLNDSNFESVDNSPSKNSVVLAAKHFKGSFEDKSSLYKQQPVIKADMNSQRRDMAVQIQEH